MSDYNQITCKKYLKLSQQKIQWTSSYSSQININKSTRNVVQIAKECVKSKSVLNVVFIKNIFKEISDAFQIFSSTVRIG